MATSLSDIIRSSASEFTTLLDAYISNGSFEHDVTMLTPEDAEEFCALFRGTFKKQSAEDVEKGILMLTCVTRLGFEHHLIPLLRHGLGASIEAVRV